MTSADSLFRGKQFGQPLTAVKPSEMPRMGWLRRRRVPAAPGSRMIASATGLLFLLGAGLLGVSLAAQYRYLLHERGQHAASLVEALALDLGLLIFSLLALGLARAGKQARVERALILVCAAGSAGMNLAAANDGSPRSIAAYTMPPIFLAIVSDRVISVVRRHFLGDTEVSAWSALRPAVVVGARAPLYLLRLVVAPGSTVRGARQALLIATPLPPAPEPPKALPAPAAAVPEPAAAEVLPELVPLDGDGGAEVPPFVSLPPRPAVAVPPVVQIAPDLPPLDSPPQGPPELPPARGDRSKRVLLIEAYEALDGTDPQYGDRSKVSPVAAELGPRVGLQPGSARTYLYRHLDERNAR
jgi:hypothetical protein